MISFVAHLLIRVTRLGDSVSGFCIFKYRWVVFLACHSFLPHCLTGNTGKSASLCWILIMSRLLSSWKVSYVSPLENMSWPILSFCHCYYDCFWASVAGSSHLSSLCPWLFPSSGHPQPSQNSVSCRAVVPFYPGPMQLTEGHGGVFCSPWWSPHCH